METTVKKTHKIIEFQFKSYYVVWKLNITQNITQNEIV